MIKNVYIRTRPGTDSAITESLLLEVGDVITNKGLYIIHEKNNIDATTLVLALGGDGTMMSAIRIAAIKGAFVTGFNFGHLGYLVPDTASTVDSLKEKLIKLLDGSDEYKTTVQKLPLIYWKKKFAVNDFYFVPAASGTAADFKVAIGDDASHFNTKSSGIVISTPFGSTGLALSAGGAILSPNSHVLEVVPMLPHTLTSRSIIVSENDTIVVSWNHRINIFADGHLLDSLDYKQVELKCKKRKINLIQPANWDFFENLKNKMKWQT